MIKYISFVIIAFSSLSSNCQQLKIKDLLDCVDRDYSYFETKVTENGFQYFKHKSEENYESYHYAYNRTSSNKSTKFVDWTTWKYNGLKVIYYQTTLNQEYISLKNEMKILGFKFKNMYTFNEQQFLIYGNTKIEITIVTGDAGNGITFYEFKIKKIRKTLGK
jgi:hypothetical protein